MQQILTHPSWAAQGGELQWVVEYGEEIVAALDDVYTYPHLQDVRAQVESTYQWQTISSNQWHKGKLTTTSYQLQTLERLCVTALDEVVEEAGGFKMAPAHDASVNRKDSRLVQQRSQIASQAIHPNSERVKTWNHLVRLSGTT